ncbi:polysaccharide biosynthesis protein [Phycicoccus sp. BSK3Z-2]|uniref:Polysaccharide biosynthesis protein n=1 Tax=Phycicoccus avicenniae TaxID=2828860 RepID=A0A941HZ56_9MICO|nr:polysaccharide biosynthesis protein [Phycicoccus avicenniae]MBR7742597.1 polysaccharide biosynthesis protein [Phycicoccus avicenniae]
MSEEQPRTDRPVAVGGQGHAVAQPSRRPAIASARRWPTSALCLLDAAVLVVVIVVLALARYDLETAEINRQGLGTALGLAVAVHVVTYLLLVARRTRWGSQDEVVGLGVVTAFLVASLTAVSVSTTPALLPATVALAAPLCAFSGWLALRYLARQYHRSRRRRGRSDARRAIVVGAGWGGQRAVAMMLDDSASTLMPVAIVDDDRRKQSHSVSGVRVQGLVRDLPRIAARTEAEVVLLAVPSAPPGFVEQVVDLAEVAECELLVLPSFDEIVGARDEERREPGSDLDPRPTSRIELSARQPFRSVNLEDLLGRGAVHIDEAGIEGYLRDQVVLVTGAGGSIGSQLCREIAAFAPARLVVTDRDDSLLHATQLSLDGRGLLDSEDLVLGDLRDRSFVRALVRRYRPDVVFHAAAVKHLTLAERFPGEAFLTNVAATSDLLTECVDGGVERFVNISTDKAADPRSVLGYSKRITERLTATLGTAAAPGTRYISVRFGNVLGSRGSALATFATQLSAGLPLTITSPEMTRYFMTVHEATQLVLQAGVHGRTGEGLILDMGTPHNIEDLARRFAALQGYPEPTIRYTGVRPGEKLEERVLAESEPDERPYHPLVSHVTVPVLHPGCLDEIDRTRDEVLAGSGEALVASVLPSLAASPAPAVHRDRTVTSGRP